MSGNAGRPSLSLYAETTGPVDAPPMLFIHPNPMDSSCWLYQMAHFSTWHRCVAIDLPGYGRSPALTGPITMIDVADACWRALDSHSRATGVVLVGCSVGSTIAQHMYHRRPDQVAALILAGTGWQPVKDYAVERIRKFTQHGVAYRREYILEDFSTSFRDSTVATWMTTMLTERNDSVDTDTVIRMFRALALPDPDWLQSQLNAPALIISGTEDVAHPTAAALQERLPDAELRVLRGAGHACHIEQPTAFDRHMLRFLAEHRVPPHSVLP